MSATASQRSDREIVDPVNQRKDCLCLLASVEGAVDSGAVALFRALFVNTWDKEAVKCRLMAHLCGMVLFGKGLDMTEWKWSIPRVEPRSVLVPAAMEGASGCAFLVAALPVMVVITEAALACSQRKVLDIVKDFMDACEWAADMIPTHGPAVELYEATSACVSHNLERLEWLHSAHLAGYKDRANYKNPYRCAYRCLGIALSAPALTYQSMRLLVLQMVYVEKSFGVSGDKVSESCIKSLDLVIRAWLQCVEYNAFFRDRTSTTTIIGINAEMLCELALYMTWYMVQMGALGMPMRSTTVNGLSQEMVAVSDMRPVNECGALLGPRSVWPMEDMVRLWKHVLRLCVHLAKNANCKIDALFMSTLVPVCLECPALGAHPELVKSVGDLLANKYVCKMAVSEEYSDDFLSGPVATLTWNVCTPRAVYNYCHTVLGHEAGTVAWAHFETAFVKRAFKQDFRYNMHVIPDVWYRVKEKLETETLPGGRLHGAPDDPTIRHAMRVAEEEMPDELFTEYLLGPEHLVEGHLSMPGLLMDVLNVSGCGKLVEDRAQLWRNRELFPTLPAMAHVMRTAKYMQTAWSPCRAGWAAVVIRGTWGLTKKVVVGDGSRSKVARVGRSGSRRK